MLNIFNHNLIQKYWRIIIIFKERERRLDFVPEKSKVDIENV